MAAASWRLTLNLCSLTQLKEHAENKHSKVSSKDPR